MSHDDDDSLLAPNLSHLLPIPASRIKSGFTTSTHLKHSLITPVTLSDAALGVHKVSSHTPPHKLVSPPHFPSHHESADDHQPPPQKAWEAYYPKGSINPGGSKPGGFSFYLSGPKPFADKLAAGAKEVVFGYRMMLQPGWEFVKGGKLPGVFGGVGELSYQCTGGRQDHRCQCFDLRPMWRAKGAGELYTYLPLTKTNTSRLLAVPPQSKENSDYGFSVGRGSFSFDHVAVGRWVSVALRMKMNEEGEHDGEIQVWIDGKSVIFIKGISLCQCPGGKIKGMHFQTFFGGHTEDWASPKDQRAWFADVSGAILN